MKCPICKHESSSIGSIPFDRNNNEVPIVDTTPMEYYRCDDCAFIFCPEMLSWTPEQLGDRVYNKEYVKYDPDFVSIRPTNYAEFFKRVIPRSFVTKLKHLDYGAGDGVMSEILRKSKWNSTSYDPYYKNSVIPESNKYNFITAIEVFEHSLDIDKTIKDIKTFMARDCVLMFSTLLTDNLYKSIDWWYIGARNGHIGMLSKKSLKILAINNNLYVNSIDDTLHIMTTNRASYKNILGLVINNGR